MTCRDLHFIYLEETSGRRTNHKKKAEQNNASFHVNKMLVNCFIANGPVKVDLTIEQAKKKARIKCYLTSTQTISPKLYCMYSTNHYLKGSKTYKTEEAVKYYKQIM
jgi:hypothetical protein